MAGRSTIPIIGSSSRQTPQPFGGRRWWFVCPRTGRRAVNLYLPNGAFSFASRQAYRLTYRSQRETSYDRALRRAFKLRGKLGADGGVGDYVPKPKWMRWPTYDRKLEEVFAAEGVVGAFSFASRQAYRLTYRSQRETSYDRALRRAFKLRGKLGADGGVGDYVPKPKWMRWPTYDRKLEEVFAAEGVVDAYLGIFVNKLNRRIRK